MALISYLNNPKVTWKYPKLLLEITK